ncbi:MAG: hypothetical protein JXX28_02060 [Deltaproteobacteria bacterium]|nr:hypothetical protein [Deltaproteobacteria bacterium]
MLILLSLIACQPQAALVAPPAPEGGPRVTVVNLRANPITLDLDYGPLTPFLLVHQGAEALPLQATHPIDAWPARCERTCGEARAPCDRPPSAPLTLEAFAERSFPWSGQVRAFQGEQGCFQPTEPAPGEWTLEVYAHPEFRTHPLGSACVTLPAEALRVELLPDLWRAWSVSEKAGTGPLLRVAEAEVGAPPLPWRQALEGASAAGGSWRFQVGEDAISATLEGASLVRQGEGWHLEGAGWGADGGECPGASLGLTLSGPNLVVWEHAERCAGVTALERATGERLWGFSTGSG